MASVEIELTKGFVTVVDKIDLRTVYHIPWYAHFSSYHIYARNTEVGRLHRVILNPPPHLFVDHKNGDTLDNRRSNLRVVTTKQNNRARKPLDQLFKGVYKVHRGPKPWRAWLKNKKNGVHIGLFDTALEAALAYDAEVIRLKLNPDRLNFPST